MGSEEMWAQFTVSMANYEQGGVAQQAVGFKSVRSRTLDTDWGPLDLDIGRKGKILNSNKIEEKEE